MHRFLGIVLLLASCDCWHQIGAADPTLGPALRVAGDNAQEHAPCQPTPDCWHRWVVIENTDDFPVVAAFQSEPGKAEYSTHIILPHEQVALRLGPGDVQFRFKRTSKGPPPRQPMQIGGVLDEQELIQRFPTAVRL